MGELVLRFVIGGVVVSAFAVLAEIFRPKSFAGLFNAAPSIALATIGITIARHGALYAATESRSMALGAVGFFCYCSAACWLLMRLKIKALTATVALLPLWFGVSVALWWELGR
jgi:Protein of unknown function (DUF3147)